MDTRNRAATMISWRQALWQSRYDAWNKIGSQLTKLSGAAKALNSISLWQDTGSGSSATGISSSDTSKVSASVSGTPIEGTYLIEVSQLASNEVWIGDGSDLDSGPALAGMRESGAWYAGAGSLAGGGTRMRDITDDAGNSILANGDQITMNWRVADGTLQSAAFNVTNGNRVNDLVDWAQTELGIDVQLVDGKLTFTSDVGKANEVTELSFSANTQFDSVDGAQTTVIQEASDGALPEDTLTITAGSSSWDITIAEGATITEIADAINSSGATVAASVNGNELRLESTINGEDGVFSITSTGDLAGALGLYQDQQGQDASYSVDGINYTSSSNSSLSGIDGIELNLHDVTTSPVEITFIEPEEGEDGGVNVAAISDAVNDFVKTYNETISMISDMQGARRSFGAETKEQFTQSPLGGNQTLVSMLRAFRRWAFEPIGGADHLGSIGISTGSAVGAYDPGLTKGHLVVDEAALEAALQNDPDSVRDMLSGGGADLFEKGLASRMDSLVTSWNVAGGLRSSAQASAAGERDRAQDRLNSFERRTQRISGIQAKQMQAYQQIVDQMYAKEVPMMAMLFGLGQQS